MKTYFVVLFIISLVLNDFSAEATAAQPPKRQRRFTHEQLVEREKISAQKRYGGKIRKAGSATGKVIFVNAQKIVPVGEMNAAFSFIDKQIKPIWEIREVDSISLDNPKEEISQMGGNIGVVIADSNSLPALITAPEEGWAIVNVAKLAKGAEDKNVISSRVRKEIMRAFALAGGCAFMARGPIVLRPDIHVPSDLDVLSEESYGVEPMLALTRLLPYFGVTPWLETTYKKACQEGWAPAPTNEFQKAIWDKVHAMPTEPIKIKPETKKVAE